MALRTVRDLAYLCTTELQVDIKRNGLLYWAGAFGMNEQDAGDAFAKIPNDTDVLVLYLWPLLSSHSRQAYACTSGGHHGH